MTDQPARLLTMAEVVKRTGICRTNIYRLIARGEFAPVVRLSPSRIAFLESDLAAWLHSRREGSAALLATLEASRKTPSKPTYAPIHLNQLRHAPANDAGDLYGNTK
ncbi:helix-turn-helix transcriptional regulator [Paraburkholderia aromaticivorans]|uniref:helix-turn-helix transcriptional regulator n=1 Tax=Paraburkholderia aromaticivorans TaxID=2026199 RepID=UPI0014560889|nr:AlpA family phage regulatory protein [Paraburkholderia aromaticivorans]